MKNAPRGGRDSTNPGSLDEFASDASRGRPEEPAAWEPPEDLDAQGPPPTPVYLAEIEGLDAFAVDQPLDADPHAPPARSGQADRPAGMAPSVAAASTSRVSRGGRGPTAARPAAPAMNPVGLDAARTASRPMRAPHAGLPVPRSRRPRTVTYLYAAASVAVLALLTIALLNVPSTVVEQPFIEQPLARNDLPPASAAPETPGAVAARPLEPQSDPRPVEAEPTAAPAQPATPVERSVPAATPRAERDANERPAPRPPFPASQTLSAPVPTTGAPANLSQDSARPLSGNAEAVAAPPRPEAVAAPRPAVPPPALPEAPAAAAPPAAGIASSTIAAPTSTIQSAPITASPASTQPPGTPPPVAGLATPPANAPAATPAPAAAAPAITAPAPSAIEIDTREIRQVLDRYRNAFNALDATAARQAWPTVNQRALERAFDRLDEQNVSFDDCQINVRSPQAQAVCGGTVRYVPSVGSRTPQVERRQWTFTLRRDNGGWLIQGIETR